MGDLLGDDEDFTLEGILNQKDWFHEFINPDPDFESVLGPVKPLTEGDLRDAMRELREEIDAEYAERERRIEAAAREARLKDMGLILSRDMALCEPSPYVPAGQAYIVDAQYIFPKSGPIGRLGLLDPGTTSL